VAYTVARQEDPVKAKGIFFKVSPDLSDGDHWTIVDGIDVLMGHIKTWCEEFYDQPGYGFEVEVVEMTRAEVDALPEL
jgi:hypothetical protein